MPKRSDMPEWKICVFSGSLRTTGGGVFACWAAQAFADQKGMVFEAPDPSWCDPQIGHLNCMNYDKSV